MIKTFISSTATTAAVVQDGYCSSVHFIIVMRSGKVSLIPELVLRAILCEQRRYRRSYKGGTLDLGPLANVNHPSAVIYIDLQQQLKRFVCIYR